MVISTQPWICAMGMSKMGGGGGLGDDVRQRGVWCYQVLCVPGVLRPPGTPLPPFARPSDAMPTSREQWTSRYPGHFTVVANSWVGASQTTPPRFGVLPLRRGAHSAILPLDGQRLECRFNSSKWVFPSEETPNLVIIRNHHSLVRYVMYYVAQTVAC